MDKTPFRYILDRVEQFNGVGKAIFVDTALGSNDNDGTRWNRAKKTITSALAAATAGDVIYIARGDYDEAVSITKDNLTLVGVGARGAVAIAPSAANSVALTVDGTGAGGRVEEVELVNLGCEGKGTGGGLLAKGNIRRLRVKDCKLEGGAYGTKLESTAQGSVGDVRFEACEFAWATTALHLTASGGGSPVTNVLVKDCLFQNFSGRGVLSDVAHTTGLWVQDCFFAREEDGTEPANEYVKVNVASSEGLFAGNYFATATNAVAKFALATGVIWAGNVTEAGVSTARPA